MTIYTEKQTDPYSYDALRQLTQAWTPAAVTECSVAPSQVGLTGLAPFWNDYEYDTQSGNRVSVTTRGPAGAAASATLTYPTAGAVRPHGATTVTGDASLGAGAYEYDAAGNMIARPGQTVAYNEMGKVATVAMGAETQSNVYDAAGMLLLRVSSIEGATLFLGDTVLTQPAGSSVTAGTRTYAGAQGIPVAQRTAKTGTVGSTVSWLFADLHGTVDTQTVASSGVTTRQYRDPFGVPTGGATGVWPDGSGFLHKPVTVSTGLTTVGARTYDPVLGKFTSVDAVVAPDNPQQNIGYGYSGNNPTTFSDPTGDCYNYRTDSLTLSTNCAGGNGIARDDSETKKWRAANKAKNPAAAVSKSITATSTKPNTGKPSTKASSIATAASMPALGISGSSEPDVPSDSDIWNGLSVGFGWVSIGLNGLGSLAALACFGGPHACAIAAVASKAVGFASLPFAGAAALTDCMGNNWDRKCWGGILYTGGATASTILAPPFVGNGVSAGMGLLWMVAPR